MYEQPVHALDFTFAQDLPAGFALKFKAGNLLDPAIELKQGDVVVATYKRGRSFSLGLSWRPELSKKNKASAEE